MVRPKMWKGNGDRVHESTAILWFLTEEYIPFGLCYPIQKAIIVSIDESERKVNMRVFCHSYLDDYGLSFEEEDIGTKRYIFSSEKREYIPLNLSKILRDPSSRRWYGTDAFGYICYRDLKADLETDEIDKFNFWEKNPNAKYKETYEDLWFGENKDYVEYGRVSLDEYDGKFICCRTFIIENYSFEQLETLEKELLAWHLYGILPRGFEKELQYGTWIENSYW